MKLDFKFEPYKRIKLAAEFRQVQTLGQKFYTKNFLIAVRENNLEHSRLGLVVSKKISKKSVLRNLVKRRLREVYRRNQHDINPGFDLVIIARNKSFECDYAEIERQIMSSLRYNKLANNKS